MTAKNITILQGSPRKGGNTREMAGEIARSAQEKNYRIHEFLLSELSIKNCLACDKCWTSGRPCVQNDPMTKIYPMLESSEFIIFSSPLYFYTWSSYIKPLWDRLIAYAPYKNKTLQSKKVILVSASGDDNLECYRGLQTTFQRSCSVMGWTIAGELLAAGAYKPGDWETMGWKDKIREFCEKTF